MYIGGWKTIVLQGEAGCVMTHAGVSGAMIVEDDFEKAKETYLKHMTTYQIANITFTEWTDEDIEDFVEMN